MCPFPFNIEGRVWVVIVLIPDHCFSVYYGKDICTRHLVIKSVNTMILSHGNHQHLEEGGMETED